MATNDELLKIWAQQNGSDYNVLAGAQNGGNTGSSQSAANDLYSQYGWDSGTLPGTNIPTGGTTTTPTTTTGGTSTTSGGTPGYTMQDYFNYYGNDWTKADKDYNQWVAWMQSGGGNATTPTTPTTPTGTGGTGTTPSTTPSTTPTQPSANPSPMDEWNAIMARVEAGTATTADYARAQELAAILSGGGTGGTGGGSSTTPTGGGTGTGGTTADQQSGTPATGQPTTGSTVDAMTEWQQIMARVNAGQGTIADYYRLQELAGIMTGGGTGTGTGTGTGIGGIGGTGGTGTGTGAAFHEYPAVNPDREQAIRDMYDAQINAERAALQEQGDQALSDAQANRDNIAKLYNQQRNAASVEWERQRRNFLEGAATSGLNTGAGSQAELSMMSMAQREQNNLGAAQAGAEAEADRNMADIRRSTQAAINEAVMKNDYQKAAALLDEYNEQYNRAMDRAEALAQYGDFSGYAALYGNEAAAQMRQTWVMSNPEIALALGLITQGQYAQLTLYSQYPALALTGGAGFSGGGGGDYSGGGGGTSDWQYGAVYNMGELIDAAAAGMSRSQIEQALAERGVDVTQPTVQADITTALSK